MSKSDLTPGSWNFSTVRKGYDPKEVRAYLTDLEAALAEARAAAGSASAGSGPTGDAGAEGAAIVDAARQQAAQILADARTAASQLVPGEHAGDASAGVNRWDSLGENIARVLRQAESEAEAIRVGASNEAQAARMEAEHVRTAAEGDADATRAKAQAVLADAEQRAREIVAISEDRATEEAATVVARAEAALAPKRDALDKARAELEDLHERIGSALTRAMEPLDVKAVDDAVAEAATDVGGATPSSPRAESAHVVDWTGGATESSAPAGVDPSWSGDTETEPATDADAGAAGAEAPATDRAPESESAPESAPESESAPEPEPAPESAPERRSPSPAPGGPGVRDSWSETGLPAPAPGAPWTGADRGPDAGSTGSGTDFWPAPPTE